MFKLVVIGLALNTLAIADARAAEAPDLPRSLQITKEIREVRGKPAMEQAPVYPVEEHHVASSGARDPGGR